MKIILTCLLAWGLTSGFAQTIDKLMDKPGYKSLWFEMPVDSFTHKIKAEKPYAAGDGLDACKITDVQFLSFGDCKLEEARAFFSKGKLLRIQFIGAGNYDCLVAAFKQHFGPPAQSDASQKVSHWSGKKMDAFLSLNPGNNSAIVMLICKKIKK